MSQTQNMWKAPDVLVVWILQLSVTLTSDCQQQQQQSEHLNSSCVTFQTTVDCFCVCVPGSDPTAAFGAEFRLFLPEAFPFGWTWHIWETPIGPLSFYWPTTARTNWNKVSQPTGARAKRPSPARGEEQGGGCVCVCVCVCVSLWKLLLFLPKSAMKNINGPTWRVLHVVAVSSSARDRLINIGQPGDFLLLFQDYFNTSSFTCTWVKVQ